MMDIERLSDDIRNATGAHRVVMRDVTTRAFARVDTLARAIGVAQGAAGVTRLDDGGGHLRFVPGGSGFTAFEVDNGVWRMG